MTVAAVHVPEMGEITMSPFKDPYLNGNPTMGSHIVINGEDSHGIWAGSQVISSILSQEGMQLCKKKNTCTRNRIHSIS